MDGVPLFGGHRADPAVVEPTDEAVAGPGQDDHPVLRVVADITEAVAELLVRSGAPHEGAVVAVQPEREDAVNPLHRDVAVTGAVLRKGGSHETPRTGSIVDG